MLKYPNWITNTSKRSKVKRQGVLILHRDQRVHIKTNSYALRYIYIYTQHFRTNLQQVKIQLTVEATATSHQQTGSKRHYNSTYENTMQQYNTNYIHTNNISCYPPITKQHSV
jgi:hypothetical protein